MKFALNNSINKLRAVAFLEGWSYVLLVLIAMPFKYLFAMPQLIRPVGMAHGILFVAYVLLLLVCMVQYRWSIWKAFLVFAISLIPFGTFIWKRLYTA